MTVVLDMPMDFVEHLLSYNFDAFWNVLERKVYVFIEPMNAVELERLAQVIQQEEV